MAEVWLARRLDSESDGEEVALKRILPHLARDDRFTKMFLDEADIGSRLRHSNIVSVIEVGHEESEYFIAMEYVEGPDLAQILDRCDETGFQVSVGVAAKIVVGVLRALDYAHKFEIDGVAQNIVHRDVSPHNILVTADGVVKLIDFGVAKAVERHSKTETGFVKGKLSYMAPEQIEQEHIDLRADLFGVGALFFELLTGKTPFGRELGAVSAILSEDPPDLHQFRSDIPDAIVKAIEKSLAKTADARFESAGVMADTIEAALGEQDASTAAVAQFLAELENSASLRSQEASDLRNEVKTKPDSAPRLMAQREKNARQKPPLPAAAHKEKVELTGALAAATTEPKSASIWPPMLALVILLVGFGGYVGRHQLAAAIGEDAVAELGSAEASERPEKREAPTEQVVEASIQDEVAPPEEVEPATSAEDEEPDEVPSEELAGFTFEEAEAKAVIADAEAMRKIELSKPPENWLIEFWGPALIDAVAEPDPEEVRWDPGDPEIVDVLDYEPRPTLEEPAAEVKPKPKRKKRRVKKRPRKRTKPEPKPKPKRKKDGYKRMENALPTF